MILCNLVIGLSTWLLQISTEFQLNCYIHDEEFSQLLAFDKIGLKINFQNQRNTIDAEDASFSLRIMSVSSESIFGTVSASFASECTPC